MNLTQAATAPELKLAIAGRIRALSNAHSLLSQSRWTGADLRTLVTEELSPYCPAGSPRVDIEGPDLCLDPKMAQSLAMLLHELTTNAVKYGSLSVPGGRIRIEWSCAGNGRLELCWSETDGPPVKYPDVKGFGTRVIDQITRAELKGHAHCDWRVEGFVCEMELPIGLSEAHSVKSR